MSDVSAVAMERYIRTAQLREQQRSLKLQKLRAHGIEIAKTAAQLLKGQFKAERVVIFGSVLSEAFHESSDIDLAVWGLPEREYFKAVGQLLVLSNFEIDLVEVQYASPEILAAIAQGIEL